MYFTSIFGKMLFSGSMIYPRRTLNSGPLWAGLISAL